MIRDYEKSVISDTGYQQLQRIYSTEHEILINMTTGIAKSFPIYREPIFFRSSLFPQSGIKPMWEDPGNVRGGKWVIRLKKNKIDRAWENVCMAMLGEQFLVGPEICGVVLSTQFPEDLLSIWNRTATDTTSTNRIRDTLRRILNLPPSTHMEYKPHCDSLKYL
uniref:Eukaryotic translation initiation factor 4E type 2 n=1 Tax=Culex pipiens TaxID=7175 RepID=A0A8D8A2G1_CULPI